MMLKGQVAMAVVITLAVLQASTIRVEGYPFYGQAVIEAVPMKAQVGTPIHFDGSSSYEPENYLIDNYTWNFTVGGVEIFFYTAEFDYAFAVAGDYQVYLMVTTSWGETETASTTVVITDYPPENLPPEALIWSLIEEQYGGGACLQLSGYESWDDLGILDYNWSIVSNGGFLNMSEPAFYMHIEYGVEYQIELTVTDYGGFTDSDFLNLTATAYEPLVADAGPDQTVRVGEVVTLDGSGSTSGQAIVDYRWLVLEAVPVTYSGVVVDHTFWSAGDFFVQLTILDVGYDEDSDELIVHVLRAPNSPPGAEAGPDVTILPGTVFQFNASGSTDDKPGLTFLWNFRYNKTNVVMFGESPGFRFDLSGRYVVILTVTDAEGLSANDSITVTVKEESRGSNYVWGYVFLAIGLGAAGVAIAVSVIAHNQRKKGREESGSQSCKSP